MSKFVLAFLVLTFVSSSYALELHHASILKHQSWISRGDIKNITLEGHLENKPYLLSSATATAKTRDVNGFVNTNIHASGSHGYYIKNTSGTYQVYSVDLKLCANEIYCFHDQTHIGVANMGYFANNATSYLTSSFAREGDYRLEATTQIKGNISANRVSKATIYVRN